MQNPIPYKIEHAPAYALLQLTLLSGQTVLAESGSMVAMDSWISMKSKVKGGLFKSVKRVLGGESLFMSEFTTQDKPGELWLAPAVPGDIRYYALLGHGLMIQSSGFVACSPTATIDAQFQGFKGFFSGESLFLLHITGEGEVWFSSYGAILEISIEEDYVVDTGYVVAFEDSLDYSVETISGLSFKGLMTGVLGGEGLVCRFRGKGKVWLQSRELYSLGNFLRPFRRTKGSN
jgi:uncharacterized protein (TIGR00266 family)